MPLVGLIRWALLLLPVVVSAVPRLLNEIPPEFQTMEKFDPYALSPGEFLEQYMQRGKPVAFKQVTNDWPEPIIPNRKPGNASHSFWNLEHLTNLFPEHFLDSGSIIVADAQEFRNVLPKHHRFPPFLKFADREPELRVEYLFPAPTKPVGPTVRHVDSGCVNSYAIQMQGSKLWLLWPPPAERAALDRDLKPFGVILEPGDMLVFYPGWAHATHVVQWPSLSMSLYWDHPDPEFRPTAFLKKHAVDIVAKFPEDYCHCKQEFRLGGAATAAVAEEVDSYCFAYQVQNAYSYLVVSFIMTSMTGFVIVVGVLVNLFLKQQCSSEPVTHRRD